MSIIHKLIFVLSRSGRLDAGDREFMARMAASCAVFVPIYLVDAHFGLPILTAINHGIERVTSRSFEPWNRIALAILLLLVWVILTLTTRGAGAPTRGKLRENLLFFGWTVATLMGAPLGVIYLGPPLLIAGASVAVTVGYTLLAYSLVPEEERR